MRIAPATMASLATSRVEKPSAGARYTQEIQVLVVEAPVPSKNPIASERSDVRVSCTCGTNLGVFPFVIFEQSPQCPDSSK